MKKWALIVVCMFVASAGMAGAWGPNDPTDGKADPDGDKLGNKDEFRYGSNPLIPDTDGGGCWDGWEVMYGFLPTYPKDDQMDVDNDGWTNYREFLEGTNPLNPNTDDDCFPIDSTDPHPLIPDGPNGDPDGPGVPPGEVPFPLPPTPPLPIPLPPKPLPIPPPDPPRDSDNDGLVDFLEDL